MFITVVWAKGKSQKFQKLSIEMRNYCLALDHLLQTIKNATLFFAT